MDYTSVDALGPVLAFIWNGKQGSRFYISNDLSGKSLRCNLVATPPKLNLCAIFLISCHR